MSTKYWDLYVYYVKKCERENYINDIDPAHYQMEFNHFWPKCIFGVWPVGQYLTLRQHAIATALQTLAFQRNCLCSWHKGYLPPKLLELAWPYFCEAASVNGKKGVAVANQEKDEFGRSILGIKNAERLHRERDENGKSLQGVENGRRINSEKDENGKSVNAVKAAKAVNKEKDENGKSVNAVKGGKKAILVTNSQIWQSTMDGFIGNAGNVAQYNRARGWPGEARIRLE